MNTRIIAILIGWAITIIIGIGILVGVAGMVKSVASQPTVDEILVTLK